MTAAVPHEVAVAIAESLPLFGREPLAVVAPIGNPKAEQVTVERQRLVHVDHVEPEVSQAADTKGPLEQHATDVIQRYPGFGRHTSDATRQVRGAERGGQRPSG